MSEQHSRRESRVHAVDNVEVAETVSTRLAQHASYFIKYISNADKGFRVPVPIRMELAADLSEDAPETMLQMGATKVVSDLATSQGKVYEPADVMRVLTDPALADKYEPRVATAIAEILAERPAISKRQGKSASPESKVEL
jgi:hypothetical protein